ncbi:uncharacterized protein LOC113359402 [Papaver somniferum]|uniref:uncharacterized protein LOC113359402 n=1 Tax=Papaver somniferum TaxID=3469 RepID=UPI000E7030B2|nr:uncharacterized protein LOC113359402 [Papaver somniferum]
MGKIDRVLVNLEWIYQFQDSVAEFLNPGVSDHSPSVVTFFEGRAHGPPPFRFCNYLADDDDFLRIADSVWKEPVKGNPMVVLVTELKKTKNRLSEWRKEKFSKLTEKTVEDKKVMLNLQTSLQERPLCVDIARQERQAVHTYIKLCRCDESLDQQKYKVKWMESGDSNVKFFYNSIRERKSRNNILILHARSGEKLEDDKLIDRECVDFYEYLFNPKESEVNTSDIFGSLQFENLLQQEDCEQLMVPVTRDEVVWALSSIHFSKSPIPDGFSS